MMPVFGLYRTPNAAVCGVGACRLPGAEKASTVPRCGSVALWRSLRPWPWRGSVLRLDRHTAAGLLSSSLAPRTIHPSSSVANSAISTPTYARHRRYPATRISDATVS